MFIVSHVYRIYMQKEMREPFQIIYMTRAGEHRNLLLDRGQMIPPVIRAVSRFVSRDVAER
jgi:hypothetical protein